MADEEKKAEEGAAAEAAPEGEAVKVSLFQKFKPIIFAVGALVVGAGGASAVFLAMGPKEAAHTEAKVEGGAPAEHGGAAASASNNELEGPALKDKELEHKSEVLADIGELEDEDVHPQGEQAGGEINPAQIIKFDGLVVNIFEKNSIHYLKISMEFAVSTMAAVEEYNVIKPKLRDRALFVISDTTLREILNPGGKALLKEDLITAFNHVFKKGKVTQIFFTDFTVQ